MNALTAPTNPTSTELSPRKTSPINVPMAMAKPDTRGRRMLVIVPRLLPTLKVVPSNESLLYGPAVNTHPSVTGCFWWEPI